MSNQTSDNPRPRNVEYTGTQKQARIYAAKVIGRGTMEQVDLRLKK